MRILLFIKLCFFVSYGLIAQVTVQAALEESQITIGDQITLTLEANYPSGYEVEAVDLTALDSIYSEPNQKNPDQEAALLEILSQSDWETLKNGSTTTYRKNLKITAWQEGVYFIPPVQFNFRSAGGNPNFATNRLTLLVASPIEEAAVADTLQIAPIKDIALESWRFSDFLPILYILAGIAALIFLVFWITNSLQKKDSVSEPEIIRPAHEIALEKLQALEDAELWQKGEFKTYQSQLSYIVREYIENRYAMPALESTTGEIIQDLQKIALPAELLPKMREMLQLADMVKFAKAKPPVETHERYMKYAHEIVQTTRQLPNPVNLEEEEKDV